MAADPLNSNLRIAGRVKIALLCAAVLAGIAVDPITAKAQSQPASPPPQGSPGGSDSELTQSSIIMPDPIDPIDGGSTVGASEIIAPKSYSITPGGINVADGSMLYRVTDLAVGTLRLERSHRIGSKQPNDPMFGWNFASNFDIYLSVRPVKKAAAGGVWQFASISLTTAKLMVAQLGGDSSGTYQSPPTTLVGDIPQYNLDAEKGQLSWTGSQFKYLDADGTVYSFSATVQATGMPWASTSRKIEKIDFANGLRRYFSYDANGVLKLVEDSTGYAMVFDYNAQGDVTAACAFIRSQTYVSAASTCVGASLKSTYGYAYNGVHYLLSSATDASNQATQFANSNWGLTCLTPPGYAACKISQTYAGDRIATQVLLDGGTWSVAGWDPTSLSTDDTTAPYDGHNEVSVTDPSNTTIFLKFTKTSPYEMVDANGNRTEFHYEGGVFFDYTGPAYSEGSMLREATYPEGDIYRAEYLGPFHSITKETRKAKPGSGLPVLVVPDLVKLYGYGSCTTLPGTFQNCAKPIWIKDARNNQTDFSYASHGGVLSELQPSADLTDVSRTPATVTARPLKLKTYAQRYAWIKNSAGTLVQAATPVWVTATETQCQAAPGSNDPVCDPGRQQTVTTYEYGATGTGESLLVKGVAVSSGGTTLRTCFGYDSLHRKISETKPNANLSVCP